LKLATALVTAATAIAQPPLTTIQDTLYRADGTPFNGLLIISWNSFQADNQANVVSQSLTVKVVNGFFLVQLAPTADANPPSSYTVTYNSDGKVQFQETWVVGPSSTPVTIADVRVSTTSTPNNNSPLQPGNQTPIAESAVTGLTNDLSLRPMKGTGFSVGRAAMINSAGGIDAVIGNPSDCVFVDGTSGACGGASPLFSDAEVPGGTIDGNNTAFTLANSPSPAASLALFRNGMAQKPAVDYTLTGSTVQFLTGAVPQPGDMLLAWYRLPAASPIMGQQTTGVTPQVICSTPGTSTSSTTFTSVGACTIPANVLQTGDRVEIHFDLAHTGASVGFEYQAIWGATTLTDRIAPTAETMVAGKGEAGLYNGGAQARAESWGTVLAFAASVANATDNVAPGITVNFQAKLAQTATDTVTLVNFTVVRYPAQ
jgi:hypothetical protein